MGEGKEEHSKNPHQYFMYGEHGVKILEMVQNDIEVHDLHIFVELDHKRGTVGKERGVKGCSMDLFG